MQLNSRLVICICAAAAAVNGGLNKDKLAPYVN